MSVRDEITRLETAKSDIETAIETCGVNVPDTEKISAYASYIRQIPSAIFSELNAGPFGGEDAFIRTIKQTDGVIEATTGGLVSSSLSGLAPKIGTDTSVTISKQADEWVLASTKGATPTWRKLPVNAFKNDNNNTTYTLSGTLDGNTFVSTLTPSSGSPTTATVPAMTGASSNAAGKAGLVPAPAKNNEGKFLRGDGTWAIPSKSENSYYLYTQYQNSTDFYPNYKAYLKWIANDVAAFHFTDGTYKFKANLADSVPWTGVTGRPTALSEFTDDILANHYLPLSGGQLTGNLTLYAGSGNSPYIRFQRGSNKADTLCDWTIVDEGGYLIFREGVNGVEEDVLKICGSTNTLFSTNFNGNLIGNASSATKATNDSDGNAINTTYLKKSGGTMTGVLTINAGSITGLQIKRATNFPCIGLHGGNSSSISIYGYYGFNGADNPAFCKSDGSTVCSFLHTSNYTDYTVTKTGTGATGNWGINITGTAASASSAATLSGGSIATWGTLTAANGYTNVCTWDTGATTGAFSLAGKGGQMSLQLDGFFYQNEGKYLVLDTNNYTAYTDSRYAWGNYASQSELSDCNNVSSTGFWTHSGFTNRPDGVSDWGSLMNIRLYNSNNNYHRQLFFDCYGSDHVWTRSDVGGTWTSWKRLALVSDIGNGTVTINQAGASKGSFTLNQSTAATINLTDTNYYHTPYYSSGLSIASGTGVNAMYVPNAGASQSGVVSTGTQTFAGAKTFAGAMTVTNTITFGPSDNYGIRTFSDNYGRIGESSKRFYQCYVKNSYSTNGFWEDSDERLKNIIKPIKVDLDEVSKLRKIYYIWKNPKDDQSLQLGMIAQDVQRLYPELVSVDKETGYLSLAYDRLSVLALEAIDVLYKEHKKLKERVDELEKLLTNRGIL